MTQTAASTPSHMVSPSSFRRLRSHTIESLNLTVEEYEHLPTGASHIHLATDNEENVFLVALRTVPHDSTGVAHILEHTALCGSEKFPVRDPFFMMIRRSLNTFMNAFTSSDWTAYPFASLNRKDFNNLLAVYLDAVFFSRLDPLDFAQEGHRLEFSEPTNPDSPLVYKGVVFNEMKGAMSSITSQLWHTLCKYLYPTTTYHYNSGGDPESIVDLSYEQLKHFYQTHYHPSNAIFMTYGNISAAEHQTVFEEKALQRFQKLEERIFVPSEKRYQAPLRVEEYYPLSNEDEATDATAPLQAKTHIVLAWLLGKTTDLESALAAQLLASVLLDNSASPLQRVLETTTLGNSPSPLCGLDDSQHEMTFVCGIEGSEPDRAQAFEDLVLATLNTVAEEGIPIADVEAALHQLELQQREVGGDGQPYGLQLILTALTAATHRGDPIGLLDLDPALNKLRDAIKDPNYVKHLVKNLLIDNQHRVRLTLIPDAKLSERKRQAEIEQLDNIKQSLSEQQIASIIQRTQALQNRQQAEDDISILPKVTIADIPAQLPHKQGDFSRKNAFPVTLYTAGTNGLVYQQAILDLPTLSAEELQVLPLYNACLTELGLGNADYLAVQKRQSQVVGSLSSFSSIRPRVDNSQQSIGRVVLSSKALAKNHHAMTELMAETLHRVRFDETGRIKELVSQIRARKEQSVTGNGHSLAMAAACAGMNPVAQYTHQISGVEGIIRSKALDKRLADPQQLEQLAQQLATLHKRILSQPLQFLLVSDEHCLASQQQALIDSWNKFGSFSPAKTEPVAIHLPFSPESATQQAWLAPTQVNFCAKAYSTVPLPHPDAAALTVLGGFLRNGFLHTAIREQGGAYGGGAQQDNSSGTFRFYSYRDPRLTETLADFNAALDWLLNTKHQWQAVEEAILGVIGSIDKPSSPAGEAKQTFHAEINGRSSALREEFRNRVLQVTAEDLMRVGETYLAKGEDTSCIAVLSPQAKREELTAAGFSVKAI